MPVDRERARAAVADFLRALGADPERDPELAGTPARVANAWVDELVDGYRIDPDALLGAESLPLDGARTELVILREIAISTICPHHLLPARGTAEVAYWPERRSVGLGTIVRLVDGWAHRFTLQETIGHRVAESLVQKLGARGAACRLRLVHGCLASRGERRPDAVLETLALAGSFAEPGPDREFVLRALGPGAATCGTAALTSEASG